MSLIELRPEQTNPEAATLSARRFAIREELSAVFEISLEATSPSDDINFSHIVGHGITLHLNAGYAHAQSTRSWSGVCVAMRQLKAERTGLSTYLLSIEPKLSLLKRRKGYRLCQHQSIPEIIRKILSDWKIEHDFRLDIANHPKLELRTQYEESDFDFLARLLEEAGISFYFEHHESRGSVVVFKEEPQRSEPRAGGALVYVDNPNEAAEREYVKNIQFIHELRPGRRTLIDQDFRRGARDVLEAHAIGGLPQETMFAQVSYERGLFAVEQPKPDASTPIADRMGAVRHSDRTGKALAQRDLESYRATQQGVSFETNAIDLSPGTIFSLTGHPRHELGERRHLLITSFQLEGTPNGEWTFHGEAVLGNHPYRPVRRTPKPRVNSMQTAVVVGPEGEDIYTDEHGRICVQYPWDREGDFDEQSSCWIRVSHGAAGAGYGMVSIPRVGQEVLVGFLGGDIDQPVVVGSLYNGRSPVPYKLPEHKSLSGWKTASTPGGDGYNELRFDDTLGNELLHIQAERNLSKMVKVDEEESTGRERIIRVGERLVLTTGAASIIMEGGSISIEARDLLNLRSEEGDLMLTGGHRVKINYDEPMFKRPSEKEKEKLKRKVEAIRAKLKGHRREPFWQGIELRGSEEFRKVMRGLLEAIVKTRMGRALFRKIARTKHTATVVESLSDSSGCRAKKLGDANRQANGKPGKGSSSTVYFSLAKVGEGKSNAQRPPEVELGNALAKAYWNAAGMRETGETNGVKNAELRAIGIAPYSIRGCTENNLRRNLKLPLRTGF